MDDLVTAENLRSRGYGEQLMQWLEMRARESGCKFIHLDSGTARGEAHKFYFKLGYSIKAYHFGQALNESP